MTLRYTGLDRTAHYRVRVVYAGDTEGSLWKFYYDYAADGWKKRNLSQPYGFLHLAGLAVIRDVRSDEMENEM